MLQPKQKVTLLSISEALAVTGRFEMEIRAVIAGPTIVDGGQRVAVVRYKGKRKDHFLDLRPDDILLDGWQLPFKTDIECGGVFAGNACFNLIGDPATIDECLEMKALFPISDAAKAKILVSRAPRTKCDDSEVMLLYPDIETRHAVINRMKAAACHNACSKCGKRGLPAEGRADCGPDDLLAGDDGHTCGECLVKG